MKVYKSRIMGLISKNLEDRNLRRFKDERISFSK